MLNRSTSLLVFDLDGLEPNSCTQKVLLTMSGTPGLQDDQIRKAVDALLKHVEKQQAKANELLEEDELLYLVR